MKMKTYVIRNGRHNNPLHTRRDRWRHICRHFDMRGCTFACFLKQNKNKMLIFCDYHIMIARILKVNNMLSRLKPSIDKT